MSTDLVSIIMGVYNAQDTVAEAIESMLAQTYTNWEFIICDDASTDGTYAILKSYQEKDLDRFFIIRNKENKKLAYSLNHCLEYASGKYIARMDADDISLPSRLEDQVNFLRENPEIDLVGTAYQKFDEKGLKATRICEPFPNRYSIHKDSPFIHATIVCYKYVYDILDGYTVSPLTDRAEDHELWFRFFAKEFKGANLDKILYLFREDQNDMTKRTARNRLKSLKLTFYGYKMLNFPLHYYIEAVAVTLLKAMIPFRLQWYYHQFRAGRYQLKRQLTE